MPDEYLDSLSVPDRVEMWRSAVANPPRERMTRLAGTVDDGVVGFALVGPADGDPEAEVGELYAINVDPDHWGSGVGAALIGAAVEALRRDGFSTAVLWVHPDNERARGFYERGGWVDDGEERRQEVIDVEVPEVRMSLRLDGPAARHASGN